RGPCRSPFTSSCDRARWLIDTKKASSRPTSLNGLKPIQNGRCRLRRRFVVSVSPGYRGEHGRCQGGRRDGCDEHGGSSAAQLPVRAGKSSPAGGEGSDA